jgi:hypothetical protein
MKMITEQAKRKGPRGKAWTGNHQKAEIIATTGLNLTTRAGHVTLKLLWCSVPGVDWASKGDCASVLIAVCRVRHTK